MALDDSFWDDPAEPVTWPSRVYYLLDDHPESLKSAVENVLPGEIIEIHTNATYNGASLQTNKSLTIRAGAGFKPKIDQLYLDGGLLPIYLENCHIETGVRR